MLIIHTALLEEPSRKKSVKSLIGFRVGFRDSVIGGFRVRVSVILIGSDLGLGFLVGLGLGSV